MKNYILFLLVFTTIANAFCQSAESPLTGQVKTIFGDAANNFSNLKGEEMSTPNWYECKKEFEGFFNLIKEPCADCQRIFSAQKSDKGKAKAMMSKTKKMVSAIKRGLPDYYILKEGGRKGFTKYLTKEYRSKYYKKIHLFVFHHPEDTNLEKNEHPYLAFAQVTGSKEIRRDFNIIPSYVNASMDQAKNSEDLIFDCYIEMDKEVRTTYPGQVTIKGDGIIEIVFEGEQNISYAPKVKLVKKNEQKGIVMKGMVVSEYIFEDENGKATGDKMSIFDYRKMTKSEKKTMMQWDYDFSINMHPADKSKYAERFVANLREKATSPNTPAAISSDGDEYPQPKEGLDDTQSSFLKILEEMESNFAFLNRDSPVEEREYQYFYNNTLVTIPNAKDSYFVESKTSGQRYLSIALDFDLSSPEGEKACERFRMRFWSFQPFIIDKYKHQHDNEQYSVKKEGNFIGAISYEVKDGQPRLKLYAFNGDSFFSTLNQIIKEGISNKFEPYKGEKKAWMSDGQYMSKLKSYRDSYSVYFKHDKAIAHQSFYQHWPPSMFFQIFGKDSETFKKSMGNNYTVNRYEYNVDEPSLLIEITYDRKKVLIQILEKEDTQIVGVAVN